eukprot:TRINITY_DN1475_c0_g1_i1.p1 TRINITY_DN1475_c0_g1~~TRINITY_DN1475_c0_g1_i1.p1  ORF type:complete len:456 (-),score=118.34 TRINITY_DN1475_c0_g1_i1:57-1424(-)
MADVKDILGLSSPKADGSSKGSRSKALLIDATTTPITKPKKRLDGAKREILALQDDAGLGTTPPPLSLATPQLFKEKRKIGNAQQNVRWTWKAFRSSARNDSMVLHHWERANDRNDDYMFARFNKKLVIPVYSDEEYEKYFKVDDWTRDETDCLMQMCERYDLRWPVIGDRYEEELAEKIANKNNTTPNVNNETETNTTTENSTKRKDRNIEELKGRFYSIESKLCEIRGDDPAQNAYHNYKYNQELEEKRKEQYEKLYKRSHAEVAEEDNLVNNYKRIEDQLKKYHKSRKKILSLADAVIEGVDYSQMDLNFSQEDTKDKKKSKKRKTGEIGEDIFEFGVEEEQPQEKGEKEKRSKKNNLASSKAANKSSTSLSVGPKLAMKVDAALLELGIGLRPSLPTPAVTKAFTELRQDIVILLNLQKHVQQKEYHLEVLRAQKATLEAKKKEPATEQPL